MNPQAIGSRFVATTHLAILGAAFLALSGCAYGLRAASIKGARYPFERAAQVREGMLAAEVLALLGEPLVRQRQGDSETWYYYFHEATRACDVFLFGVVPVRKAPRSTLATEVSIVGGRVAKAVSRRWKRYVEPRFPLPGPVGAGVVGGVEEARQPLRQRIV